MTITAGQSRAARELLGWTRRILARKSGLSESTIRNLEGGRRSPSPLTVLALRRALEAAHVEFIESGAGVRLPESAMNITPKQCRAARALLRMDQVTLATIAQMSTTTIASFENHHADTGRNYVSAIRQVLERAGVAFEANGRVLLRK
jgi:DNA-binding XRE family transcriptional regulator